MKKMTQLVLSRTMLLIPYLLLPLGVGWVVIDQLFLNGYFQAILPFSFTSIFILRSFLSYPHIIGSTLTLVDHEYIHHYGRRLFVPLIFIVFMTVILLGNYPRFFQVSIELATAVHVIGQQFNMASLMTRLKREEVLPWKILGIGLAAAIYALISLRLLIPQQEVLLRPFLIGIIALGALVFWYLSIRLASKALDQAGRLYIWGNFTFVLAAFGFGVLRYPFLALTVGQIIHDYTAYCFYVVHDSNRNQHEVKNWLYRWLYPWIKPLGIPIVLLCPLISLSLAYPFSHWKVGSAGPGIIAVFIFFHYYTETFLWKRLAPHREWVPVR